MRDIVDNDRYPLSPRIVRLREILNKIRPETEREPLPPLRHYEITKQGAISETTLGKGCVGGYLMIPCCCSAFVRPCVSIIESLGTF
jgi:hypothetical protein